MPDFATLNWLAIAIAAVAGIVLGALWFSPLLFGKAWMRGHGFSESDLARGFGKAMGLTIIMTVLAAIALALLVDRVNIYGWQSGLKLGALVGVGIVATSLFSDAMFRRNSTGVAVIEGLHRVVFVVVMTVILAVMRG